MFISYLAISLKRCIGKVEHRRINRLFSTEWAKVYSLWSGKEINPSWVENVQYWKRVWEEEA